MEASSGENKSNSNSEIVETFKDSLASLERKNIDNQHFWNNFIHALDADPREYKEIRGKSGVNHKLLGLGVNDKDKRLVLVSDTPTAEHAAMMQVDVAAGTDLKVVVARPAAFDLTTTAKMLTLMTGSPVLNDDIFKQFTPDNTHSTEISIQERAITAFGPAWRSALQAFKFTPLSTYSQLLQLVNQLSQINTAPQKKDGQLFSLDIGTFSTLDVAKQDRLLGICPVPLFEFSEVQMETLLTGTSETDILETLTNLDIHQYFFPNAHQVGLGLVENGITAIGELENALTKVPALGHPYSDIQSENGSPNISNIVSDLIKQGTLAEFEIEQCKVTAEGEETRIKYRGRPSEGIFMKIIKAVFSKDFHFHFPPE